MREGELRNSAQPPRMITPSAPITQSMLGVLVVVVTHWAFGTRDTGQAAFDASGGQRAYAGVSAQRRPEPGAVIPIYHVCLSRPHEKDTEHVTASLFIADPDAEAGIPAGEIPAGGENIVALSVTLTCADCVDPRPQQQRLIYVGSRRRSSEANFLVPFAGHAESNRSHSRHLVFELTGAGVKP